MSNIAIKRMDIDRSNIGWITLKEGNICNHIVLSVALYIED